MTDKLKGIEPGQRVRVTFEGELRKGCDSLSVKADGGEMPTNFLDGEINAPSFKIEPIEEPIKPNDRVKFGKWKGTVIAVDEDMAWVKWDDNARSDHHVDDLERVK